MKGQRIKPDLDHPLVAAIAGAFTPEGARKFEKTLIAHAHDPRLPGAVLGVLAIAQVLAEKRETREASRLIVLLLGKHQRRIQQARGEL